MKLKPLLFRLLAISLPLLVLIGVEGVLRLAGVEQERQTVFRAIPGEEAYQALNPAYVQRYFRGFVPGVAFNPFRERKQQDVFRVFVLGGSSAAGFPYHFYYGFPARLAARLERTMGRPVEVVNLGMTAVNSYTLWDLRGAVAAQRPDAVLIYAGHNEYYGAFGAGSTIYALGNQVWLKRLTLRLKRTVLYSLLEGVLAGSPEARPAAERTMMARVVRDATITREGEVYEAGLGQYEANMRDVLATLRDAEIPVYLATLASNLKDQPPLGDDPAALAAYRRGEALLEDGDAEAARAAFLEAKEYDDIRFRAPEALNEKIRALAAAYGGTLVDVQAMLRRHSPEGIEGATLFDDHLHPNARGYDLMADLFFRALRAAPDAQAPRDTLRLDPFEAAHARLQIERLTGGYPFDKAVTPAEEDRRYRRLLEAALQGPYADSLAARALTQQTTVPEALLAAVELAKQQGDTLSVLLHYRALLHWQPFNETIMREATGYALEAPAYDEITGDIGLFAANRSDAVYFLNAVAAVRLRQGYLDEAARLLEAAEHRDPDSKVMLYNRARLLILQGDTLRARPYFERYQAAQ